MSRALLFLMVIAAAGAQASETDSGPLAAGAAQLEAAETGREALAALGAAAAAEEEALASLRDDIRALAERADLLRPALDRARESAFAAFVALDRIRRATPVATAAHPAGPLAAARAASAIAALEPALRRRAEDLRALVAETRTLAANRRAATESVRNALARLRAIRAEIAVALDRRVRERDKTAIDAAVVEARALLSRSAATLADAMTALPPRPAALPARPPFSDQAGALKPPVVGALSRRFGDADADGPLKGVEMETSPYALVRAPAIATLRYAGPVGARGTVAILEPEIGSLIVLAGLGSVDRAVGSVVRKSEPLGAMSGPPPETEDFLIEAGRGKGTLPRETLYIEVWRNGEQVDPALWFAFAKERTND